jgi:hypothetical protein
MMGAIEFRFGLFHQFHKISQMPITHDLAVCSTISARVLANGLQQAMAYAAWRCSVTTTSDLLTSR